jgi:hypothetical protein
MIKYFKSGFWFLFLLVGFSFPIRAQSIKKEVVTLSAENASLLHTIEDSLGVLAYAIVNDSIEKERFAACKVFITQLKTALKVPGSFLYPFSRLQSISIQTPPDSTFRVFSWQLFVNDSTYRYYGAIQTRKQALELFPLIDRSDDIKDDSLLNYSIAPEKWYGALYYNLRAFPTKSGTKYLLFGFDAYSFFDKRKVIDVLDFDTNGKPRFGAPVFKFPDSKKDLEGAHRLLLEYSADASVKCNWDEQYEMILFDHLLDFPSPYGRGLTRVPDGSYDGLKFEKGYWKYIDKVFNDFQEEAPTPVPVQEARKGKNILGKETMKKPEKGG